MGIDSRADFEFSRQEEEEEMMRLGPPVFPARSRQIAELRKCGQVGFFIPQVNSDRLNWLESESFPRSPLISSPSAAPCSSAAT